MGNNKSNTTGMSHIDAVLEAEKCSEQDIAKAQSEQKEQIAQAVAATEKVLTDSLSAISQADDKRLAAQRQELAQTCEDMLEKAREEASVLSTKANTKLDKVVDLVVQKVLDFK